ncbi:polycystic kidney disease and receptor for egg jelly-related protein-like [Carcharodon carcharias]|uniref:polycystic kidney disease and receptor for egg jelly-related protein-like n=1 Tax=Carcharodon carcharias TaxID=13397 RepID=UPI001B7F1EF8|nr:polycystic kidney disease and receptor for egg jelly-related protein-like [Carcharodon carcharias]
MLSLWLCFGLVAAQALPAPPVLLECEFGVRHRQDSVLRYTCLWQRFVELTYRPTAGTDTRKPPPTLTWFIDQRRVASAVQWSGRQNLGRVPPDSPITLAYSSASCPTCRYQNLTIHATALRVQFFTLRPNRVPVIYRDLELAWCANLNSLVWSYRVTCPGGGPTSATLLSSQVTQIASGSYPPGKEAACSQDFHYTFKVQYPQVGNYSCNLDLINGSLATLTISVQVKPAMLHLLSTQSATIHRRVRLVVSWQLWTKGGFLTYQLAASPAGQSSWTSTYHPNAIESNICPCTWPRPNECITQLLLKVGRIAIRTSATTITFHQGAVRFVNHGRLLSLKTSATMSGTAFYYISSNNQLYYSKVDTPPGSHRHFLLLQAPEVSHLFQIDYTSPEEYSVTIQLYLNLKGTIYNSLEDMNVSLSLFNSGPVDMGLPVNVVWFIPLQHPAMQCAWAFELNDGTAVHLYEFSQKVADAPSYIPEVQLTFNPMLYSGFLARVTCSTAGEMMISLRASVGNYSTTPQDSVLFCNLPECRLPLPTIEHPPPPDTIIRNTKGSPLTVYGNSGLHCNSILSVTISWKIYEIAGIKAQPNWNQSVPLQPRVRTSTATLHLPAFSLDYGFYLFVLNVTMSTSDPTLPYVNNSCHAVVKVTKSELVALIAGGSYRTVSLEDSITLDASMSADPDSSDPHLGLNFSWYCTMKFSDYSTMTLSKNHYCHPGHPDLKWNSAILDTLVIPSHMLITKKDFYFRLVIQKDTRTSYFDQTISVYFGFVPQVLITCIENCGTSLIPTDRFILNGSCSNCPSSSELKYHWSLLSESAVSDIIVDWVSDSSTGNSLSYMSLNPMSFLHLSDGWYNFELRVTIPSGAYSLNRYHFYINSPPRAGRCVITPKEGWALQTKFTIICVNFEDSDHPLSYKVIAKTFYPTGIIDSLKNNLLGTIVYFGYSPKSPPFLLPVGSTWGQHLLIVAVQVFDSHGAYTQVNLRATVYDLPVDLRQKSLVDQLSGFIEGERAPLTTLLHETNYLEANQLLYEVAAGLNSNSFMGREKAKVSKLRETLVNVSTIIPVTSPKLINQISATIFEAAQKPDEVNQQAQRLAVTKLLELSSVLLNYTSEDAIPSESTEQLSCSILTAASNVMAAFSSQFPTQGTEKGISLTTDQEKVTTTIFPTLKILTDAVSHSKVPGQKDTLLQTRQWEIIVKKVEKRKLQNSYISDPDCTSCIYPVLGMFGGATQPVSSVFYKFEQNPLPWLGKASHIVTDVSSFHMTIQDHNGSIHNLVPKQVDSFMVRKDILSTQPIKLFIDSRRSNVVLGQFTIVMNSTSAQEVFLQLLVDLDPIFMVSIYSGKGTTNLTQKHTVPVCNPRQPLNHGHQVQDPYIIRIPTNLFQKNATHPNSSRYVTVAVETKYARPQLVITAGLKISVFIASCLTFQGNSDTWDSSLCTMGPLTNLKRLHCICKSFGNQTIKRALNMNMPWFLTGSVLVLPDTIDLLEVGQLIQTLPRNLVTLITVLVIFFIYSILLWRSCRKRESDKKKIVILLDNDPCDAACYLVTFYTGGRLDAGTTADVFMTLIGTLVESEVHLLRHPDHKTFRRNSVDTFLLTTKDELGELLFIQVWHNNVGPSPSWYLSRVKVQNVLTKHTWHFFCRKWLGIMKGDGLLHRIFPAIDPDALLKRKDVFFIETSSKIEREHLWFSVFAYDVNQSFTRIQRLSCCLTMLLSSLLLNLMLFQKKELEDRLQRLLRSLVIGVESALVMVPVEILMSTLFIYAQKKDASLTITEGTEPEPNQEINSNSPENPNTKPNSLRERLKDWYQMDEQASEANESPKEAAETPDDDQYNFLSYIAGVDNIQDPLTKRKDNCIISESVADQINSEENIEKAGGKKVAHATKLKPMAWFHQNRPAKYKKGQGRPAKPSKNIGPSKSRVMLSRCLLYLAWCLVCLLSAVSAVFIVLYGLSYGVETSWLWLMASIVSFIQGVFLLQPLKIMVFAAIFALRRRRPRDLDWSTGIQVLQVSTDDLPKNDPDCLQSEVRVRKPYRPLEGDELILAKRKGTLRFQAFMFCKGFLLHLVFLGLLTHLVCTTDYNNAYFYNNIIWNKFSEKLEQANTVQELYTWMALTFLPLIHEDSNPAFLSDTKSRILGLPRMRQLRSELASVDCFGMPSALSSFLGKHHCRPLFNVNQQDTKNYNGSWQQPIGSMPVRHPLDYTGWVYETLDFPWLYHSHGAYYVYPLGGYSLYFSPTSLQSSRLRLLALQNASWVDRSTWAIIIETTIYNANIDLFTSISLILETVPFGVINKKLVVKPFTLRLFNRSESNWIFLSVLVIIFFILFVIDECQKIKRKGYRYFQTLKNIARLVMTVLLLVTIVLYVAKFILSQQMLEFYKKNPNTFIAFHVIAALDQLLRFNVTFLIFVAVLKLLKYARFLYDVRLAQKAISVSFPAICSLAVIMALYSLIFISFGYLLFAPFDENFNSMIHATQTVVSYHIGDFIKTEFPYSKVIGGIYLASFLFIIQCILINLLESVVMLSYGDMKQFIHEKPSKEAEVANFVMQEIRRTWYALRRKTPPKDGKKILAKLFYGQGSERTYGLKQKKVKGKRMSYLVI